MRKLIAVLFVLGLVLGGLLLWQREHTPVGAQPSSGSATSSDSVNAPAKKVAPIAANDEGGHATDLEERSPSSEVAAIDRNRLPAETQFLTSKGLDSEAADRIAKSKDFDKILQQMARESKSEELVRSAAYKGNLRDYLGEVDPNFAVKDVACGEHVCLASASNKVDNRAGFSAAAMAMATSENAKMYSIVSQAVVDPDVPGSYLYRLVFTTDPDHASMTVPRQ